MPRLAQNPALLKNLLQKPEETVYTVPSSSKNLTAILELQLGQFQSNLSNILQTLSSMATISAQQFTNTFKRVLLAARYQNINEIGQILTQLTFHNYNQDQVVTLMKKCKQIDPVLALTLIWKYYTNKTKSNSSYNQQQLLSKINKVLNLILICYPVDLMLHGRPCMQKWIQIFKEEVELENQIRKVENLAHTIKCTEGGKSGYSTHTFHDIYIPL